jgi:hypothetical protein
LPKILVSSRKAAASGSTMADASGAQCDAGGLLVLAVLPRLHQNAAKPQALGHGLRRSEHDAVFGASLLLTAKRIGLKAKAWARWPDLPTMAPRPAQAVVNDGCIAGPATCDGPFCALRGPFSVAADGAQVACSINEPLEVLTAATERGIGRIAATSRAVKTLRSCPQLAWAVCSRSQSALASEVTLLCNFLRIYSRMDEN